MTEPHTMRCLQPEGLAPSPNYTPVVEVQGGRMAFVSGQIALDASGTVVGVGDFEAQAWQVFGNLRLALAAAGMDFSHVVKLGLFVTDMSHAPVMRRVRDEFINLSQPPASTLVQVAALAFPELLFEAKAVAVAP